MGPLGSDYIVSSLVFLAKFPTGLNDQRTNFGGRGSKRLEIQKFGVGARLPPPPHHTHTERVDIRRDRDRRNRATDKLTVGMR